MRSPRGTRLRSPGWPPVAVVALLAGAAAAGAATVAALVLDARPPLLGGAAAAGAAATGLALVVWAKAIGPGGDEEERHQQGPSLRRRRLIARGAVGAVVVTGLGSLIPLSGLLRRAERALAGTAWRPGTRLVTAEGRPVRADELTLGTLVTVFPEGAEGDNDAQAVLLQVEEERLVRRGERAGWSPGGLVAYSRLCTHQGCPVGLYQQRTNVLLCPCHQASFDVLDGARPVMGPARRPLPQLPLEVDGDGFIRASGDFSDPVGPGYWGMPT